MAVRRELIGEDGVDVEPFESVLSADETTEWFRAWTGSGDLNGDDFRVVGQDGTGGNAALRLVRPGRELVEQPIVFLGSEGETGAVARDLGAFLWLLADGFGPWEAATSYEPGPDRAPRADRGLAAVAERFAPKRRARQRRSSRGAHGSFPTSTPPS
ncbi:SMI1/KNR4 family protein [Streptomyces griseoviridis]|uniref:SMI1/KNR4 family protein n=1 Tax=Streptomyces griseoviridis TaxID=45398 RepID=A0ABT9LJH7_STRGD|nr:SMI1/KNR4 family protein [Streptomyces griseoviridis]MDP9683865.1 hypothetical protein [Streptomyces griseoviridis]GGS86153.1 hypothetical protein GCM10010240_19540 [Streptomyces griseoviridis]